MKKIQRKLMLNECLETRWKTAHFASLISPSKIILFEKWYQVFDSVFHHQMTQLEVRQKYSSARRIFNSLLSQCFNWCWNTPSHSWYITLKRRIWSCLGHPGRNTPSSDQQNVKVSLLHLKRVNELTWVVLADGYYSSMSMGSLGQQAIH